MGAEANCVLDVCAVVANAPLPPKEVAKQLGARPGNR
jgi:hypothetical protein